MDWKELLADGIRGAREARGWSQADLAHRARKLGWSQATVAAVEVGRREVKGYELLLLQPILGRKLADLLAVAEDADVKCGPWTIKGRSLTALAHCKANPKLPDEPVGTSVTLVWKVGDAERSVARFLKLEPERVLGMALERFGHSLTAERERRVAQKIESWPEERRSSIERLRVVRGRTTNALKKELQKEQKELQEEEQR
jgi:transcriptional regulator with XRE-family HTH domain